MIVLQNLTLRRGAKVLLDGASVSLNAGEKVALVGRNGCGKSSLFALLAGRLHEDQGQVQMPPEWRLAEVAQTVPSGSDSATDFVLAGDVPLQQAHRSLRDAERAGDGLAIAHAHVLLADAGQHTAKARAQALLLGLGFTLPQLELPIDSFSGGWRMRLQVARALLCPSDLLLLDEPTNHLDLDALVWLEGWLQRYDGTVIVISHDREFLDAVTKVTLHLEQQSLKRYGGNYSAFETLRAQHLAQQQAVLRQQQRQIERMQSFITRFRAKATKAKQAQSRVKALERMPSLAPMLAEAEFNFEFLPPAKLPSTMLALRDASLGYTPGAPILQVPTLEVRAGQRIGILGANGQGKSTLVKSLVGKLTLLNGNRREGKGLVCGYFAQHELEVLRADDSALAHLVRLAQQLQIDVREQELRDFLGRFQFGADLVKQPVGLMSGGEKARLALALIVWQRPNLLLLDEPTNHLDLNTRGALSVALNEYEGTVLLVSHDRALLRAVCDEFWWVREQGVQAFDGDVDDYQAQLLALARQRSLTSTTPSDKTTPSASEQRRQQAQQRQALAAQTRPLRNELTQLEQRLAKLNQEKQQLEARFAAPQYAESGVTPGTVQGAGQTDFEAADFAELGRRHKLVLHDIEQTEHRWLHISEQLEQLSPNTTVT